MNRRIHVLFTAIAAAGLLLGCASSRPVAQTTARPASPPVAAVAPAGDKSAAALAAEAGLRPSMRKGEQVYCKRELLTGSRTKTTETCLTTAQLERQRNSVQDLMRDVQEMSDGGRPANSADGSGGRYNSAVTQ